MIHGAFAGGWCFEKFRIRFEQRGWQCVSPDLPGHGQRDGDLAGLGLADYVDDLTARVRALEVLPVLVGHSMGGLLAQMLAARGLARAAILLAPAAPWGILPSTDYEIATARGLMALGPFWTGRLDPSFEVVVGSSLNCLPPDRQRSVFDRLGQESGQALLESMFWMFDPGATSRINAIDIECPLLCVAGARDRMIAATTVRQTAAKYGELATYVEFDDKGHMLMLESGWEEVADTCLDWLAELPVD
jgi:non-heme chloroperoxidase